MTIDDIKDRHKGHWFSGGAMSFFNSTLYDGTWPHDEGTWLFITSEKCLDDKRRWTVRKYDPKLDQISNLSKFQQFGSFEAAKAWATHQ